ncbi:protein-disulfide reductase DsbD [Xenorhabdus nematophila]|uniref:protein-disulfide reductase DsbD n=1 Tax=Xenorhabdus nematophila TaxID=628 RepID=UPI0005420A2F|nr:protein-disulfide reductase DsbD [Xenorhabdus nematophila]CEF28632.1 thiol:disulfide interchange protein, cytochrome c-type biogenesis, electron carrier, N-terminal interacts with and activates DsbC [Xenorhabdus nematophila str. Websteri]AYA39318.1 protein-disulfide reductase DsbD [Xenorhabdus nematophila]KHD28024.1 thiol:disulfide interchange protein precursor [Xenorhabdus nematophila]MBA0017897.1 protein-disulfide reductase DsbD [Xenorhabdus nematophila]MCB4426397.1 protein-disulfide redu
MMKRILMLFLLFSSIALAPGKASALFEQPGKSLYLPAAQAFMFDFQQKENQLTLSWDIKPGYYLYRKQFSIIPKQASLGNPVYAEGIEHEDEFFGKTEVYFQSARIDIPILSATHDASLQVTYQGCAEAGYCYPPETLTVPLQAVVASTLLNNNETAISSEIVTPEERLSSKPPLQQADSQSQEHDVPFSPLWAFLIGIGIAFTPCILPMYPLISSIILGQKRPENLTRIFWLAVSYVQGMALTYTILGLVVAAAGLQFQAALQSPYILVGLSVLFILLALSMFGLYTLQLPSSVQTRLVDWSNQQKSGSYIGVFIMGALAGLIASPCTTAPLSAILLYIAQSGNTLIGGLTLYLYALGMGLPLIAVTLFGHKLLPRSGPWMQYVKEGFGFIILALPVFLLERVLGDVWSIRLWSMLAAAFLIWAFALTLNSKNGWLRTLQIVLLALALIATRPLQDWIWGNSPTEQQKTVINFQQVNDWQELNQILAENRHKPIMLDLYADWCVACKEFEKYTFSDPQVQAQLNQFLTLQANVTDNGPKQKELLQRLNVLGQPTILFFDTQGNELSDARVNGFMNAERFNQHIQQIQQK